MAANSRIEWTDRTWNPITGCTRVSAGCDNCYAVTMTKRLEAMGQEKYTGLVKLGKEHFNGTVKCHDDTLLDPLKWRKPQRIFVNSMSDVFHKDVPFEFIDKIFAVMALCPHLTFQVLTKRPERAAEYLNAWAKTNREPMRDFVETLTGHRSLLAEWPIPNVWLGTSVEDQKAADERIPHLLKCPAAVRFLSGEPLLGPVDLAYTCFNGADSFGSTPGIHWVICGGESGPNARPMHPDWARSLRDQCVAAGVPFFFKQWGEWKSLGCAHALAECGVKMGPKSRVVNLNGGHGFNGERPLRMIRVGKKDAGRLLDGRTWDEFPEV